MRNRSLTIPLVLALIIPATVHAQPPAISPEQQTAMLQAGRLINAPAEFVLQHRQELALTDAQAASIQTLAAALRDSATARTARRMRESQKVAPTPALASAMNWTGPIDEAAIRDAMRRQSTQQADIVIGSARDRRAVGALLTPEQRAKLPQLQMAEMSKAMRGSAR